MEVTFPDGTRVQIRDVIVLARLSKRAKGHAQTGIYSQDIDAREAAEGQGLNVVATVADHISGVKAMWDRKNARTWVTQPDLLAKYQMIVVAKHDRLSRADWRDEGDIRRWAEDNHKVLYLTEQDLRWPPRDANDRQRWNNEAEQSRREWESTSKRYKRMKRNRRENNALAGRPMFGYRSAGVNCGQSPCLCYDQGLGEDQKIAQIYEPEAKVLREAVDRYLAGESLRAIVDDFNSRGINSPTWQGKPGTHWHVNTLSKHLRNPALAGRQMDNWGAKSEKERKSIHQYEGIITWQVHEQLVARLDSRANRKGISPGNVKMLTGILFDEAGHPMYALRSHGTTFCYYCRTCKGLLVRVDRADAEVSERVTTIYGDMKHFVPRTIPGNNHFEEIARLRQDRNELSEDALGIDEYDRQHAEITKEIRRLTKLGEESPEPDTVIWVQSGKTVTEHWESLDTAGRRDWLKENGWKVIAHPDPAAGFTLETDGEWTESRAEALGYRPDVHAEVIGLYGEAMAKLIERHGYPLPSRKPKGQ